MRLSIAQRLLAVVCLLALLTMMGGGFLLREIEQQQARDAHEAAQHRLLHTTFEITQTLHGLVKQRAAASEEAVVLEDGSVAQPLLPTLDTALEARLQEKLETARALSAPFADNAHMAAALNELSLLKSWLANDPAPKEDDLHALEARMIGHMSHNFMEPSGDQTLRMFALVLVFAAALIPFFIYAYSRTGITRPIAAIQQRLYALTNNDYDSEVPHTNRRDELGDIAFSLDVLRLAHQRMHIIEQERLAQAQSLAAHGEMMDQTAQEFRLRSEQVVDSVVAASEQLSLSSERILSAADAAERHASTITESVNITARDVQEVSHRADSSYESVTQLARASQKAQKISAEMAKEVAQAMASVAELSTASERISGVTHMIRKITERINLLALNAGIESARAGEAGKGFVVVAQEVKVLAAQTKKATEEIIDNISELQEKSAISSQALDVVNQRVAMMKDSNEEAAETAEAQRKIIGELIYSMKSANSAINTIQRSIETVQASMQQVQQSSRQVAETGRNLNVSSSILVQAVRSFLSKIAA